MELLAIMMYGQHMNLRRVKAKSGQSYRFYSQLVESYRPSGGGNPRVRVIASLGALSDIQHENLRCALEASRKARRVAILPVAPTSPTGAPKAQASLRYLDVAVLLELWRKEGIGDIVREALGDPANPAAEQVVASLALQRCIAPSSKLQAVQWYPKTALPQLLGLSTKEFNNTRVHRVLDDLEGATPGIMARLPSTLSKRNGSFVSLFVDVTDTWFVGRGPDVAHKGKTKEGVVKRKVGIVLMCNELGEPLRWEVCEGNRADNTVMTDLLRRVGNLPWLADTPVVCDRAMGRPAVIKAMRDGNVRFVTALPVDEFDRWGAELPHLDCADLEFLPHPRPTDLQQVRQAAVRAGLRKITDTMYLFDAGILRREPAEVAAKPDERPTVRAMRLCIDINQAVADGRYSSYALAGAQFGLSKALTSKYRTLERLPAEIQQDVLEGKAAEYGLSALVRVAQQPSMQLRRQAFDALLKTAPPYQAAFPPIPPDVTAEGSHEPLFVRGVAYFNPELFVQARTRERRIFDDIGSFVAALNAKAQRNPRRYPGPALHSAAIAKLKTYDMVTLFTPEIERVSLGANRVCSRIKLRRDDDQWRQRRRYHGYCLIVAHEGLPHGPEELCRLYRSKDCVEKDFQTIKGLIKIRPVHHRSTPKVRAHVTICVLALLLERFLHSRLAGKATAAAALSELESCRLNGFRLPTHDAFSYTTTALSEPQQALLKNLEMLHLADDAAVCESLVHHHH